MVAPLLLQSSLVFAEYKLGNWDLTTKVGFGAQLSNGAEGQSAKFAEYSDVRDSALGYASITGEVGAYHLGFDASRIGLKDQSYVLDGGSYGTFNYSVYYNSLFHKFSVGAVSLYDPATVGTGSLTIPSTVTVASPETWGARYDYTLTKKTYGVDASYDTGAPYSFGLGFNQVKEDGLRPLGVTSRAASTGGVTLPEPIDYKTNNFNANVGYKIGDWATNLNAMLSKFTNANPTLQYASPVAGQGSPIAYLAPKNDYYKLAWQNVIMSLPLNSTVIAKASYSKLSNTLDMPRSVGETTPGTTPDIGSFDGNIKYATANLSWAANPLDKLDTKVYYNFLRKWNRSTQITFPAGPSITSPVTNALFGYYKHNGGVDAGYKLPLSTRLGAGYEHLKIHRDRKDAVNTRDNMVYAELRNSHFDIAQMKVKYQHLARTGDFEGTFPGATVYYRSVDVTSKKQNKVTAGFDVAPIEHLDLGIEYSYSKNQYNPTQRLYGRTKDTVNGIFTDISYEMPKLFKVAAFAGYEKGVIDTLRTAGNNMTKDPALPDTTNAFKVNLYENNRGWEYGLGLDIPVIEKKWDVSLGWEQYRNDGGINFNGGDPALAVGSSGGPRVDISNFNDSLTTVVRAKTKYQFTENLSATANYMYERQTYSDFGWDGYVLNPSGMFMTGEYSDNEYKAHTGYLVAEYRF
ncbi:MAG: hypothetical protein A2X97_13000 [Bdellovibrionales bacterium GWA1_52_35]|nr:MAG: hypothetical protein A2X97_13000 [Bdellovibrionales bacterium GWA1_52_35]